MSNDRAAPEQEPEFDLKDFLKIFLVPLLINKGLILFFGLNYSQYPGEGYGWGLTASILWFLTSCGRFLWKYRNG